MSFKQTVSTMELTNLDVSNFNFGNFFSGNDSLLNLLDGVNIEGSNSNIDLSHIDTIIRERTEEDQIPTQNYNVLELTQEAKNSLSSDNQINRQFPVSELPLDTSIQNFSLESANYPNAQEIDQILSQNFNFDNIDNLSQFSNISESNFDIDFTTVEDLIKPATVEKNMALMFKSTFEGNSSDSNLSIPCSQPRPLSPQQNADFYPITHSPKSPTFSSTSSETHISEFSSQSTSPNFNKTNLTCLIVEEDSNDFEIPCAQPKSPLLNSQFDCLTPENPCQSTVSPKCPSLFIEPFDMQEFELSNNSISTQTDSIISVDRDTQTSPNINSLKKDMFIVKAKHKNTKFSRQFVSNLKSLAFSLNSYESFRNPSSEETLMWDRIKHCFNELANVNF